MKRARHLFRSSLIVIGLLGVDKVVGLLRTQLVAAAFGAGSEYDAFVAAFRLPDILFMLISGGALGTALIPILSQRITLKEPLDPAGWRLASSVLNVLFLILAHWYNLRVLDDNVRRHKKWIIEKANIDFLAFRLSVLEGV